MFYNKAKKSAIEKLKGLEKKYNSFGERANELALQLYEERKSAAQQIERVEKYINTLANTPKEFVREVADVKLSIKEFNEAVRVEKENTSDNLKGAGAAAGGTFLGGAIASIGPTAAMAIATTFSTASTGTAIATLSGAAATNAALAWLGGGALAAGGGGMAAGNAFLALAGPVGWAVAGAFIVGGGTFAIVKNRKAAKEANKLCLEVEKKLAILDPKIVKLDSIYRETTKLYSGLSITMMVNTYPNNYLDFNTEQKQALAALINNVRSMGKLINERVF